jgi:hypothetical protein
VKRERYRLDDASAAFSPTLPLLCLAVALSLLEMDPLSVLASVAGLLMAAGSVSSTLITIGASLKDVPQSVNQVVSEVNDIRTSLSAVQKFLLGLAAAPRHRIAMIQLDQLVATLTEAVLTFSELEALVTPFMASSTMLTMQRVKWLLKDDEVTPLLHRLQRHKSSLSLMLNIVQWYVVSANPTALISPLVLT